MGESLKDCTVQRPDGTVLEGEALKEAFSVIEKYEKRVKMLASRSKPEIWDIWLGAGGHNVDLSTAERAADD